MNTFNFNSDIESLISRLKQLEAENSIWKENTLMLQRSLDELKQEFRDREELQQVQTMQQTILQLSAQVAELQDRKSTRLNSSHQIISYAVFCLKKKKK